MAINPKVKRTVIILAIVAFGIYFGFIFMATTGRLVP